MSIPFGISLAEAAARDLISPIIVRQRNIGGFTADVTLEERHRDELAITENPVEQGADITDHSYKKPALLTVTVGYSNSSLAALGDPNYVNSIYDEFLTMQANRQPIEVTTGKRFYDNMLILALETFTNDKWENSMRLTVTLREVILVNTQVVSVPSNALANPSVNSSTVSMGQQQLQPAPSYNPTT